MTNIFNLVNSECDFIDELLGLGINQLRKADYQRRGIYYQSFTCLSTGLERLLKLIIIMDNYYEKNQWITESKLKSMGHNISNLYANCKNIADKYSIPTNYSDDDFIYDQIINILSEFANMGSSNRYYNLNYISQATSSNYALPKDTMRKWYEIVDNYIYTNKIKESKRKKIEDESNILGGIIDPVSMIYFVSEDNTEINTGKQMIFEKNKQILCQPYRCLFVAQIVRFLDNILVNIGDELIKKGDENIPYFSEYLLMFRGEDKNLKKRKDFVYR